MKPRVVFVDVDDTFVRSVGTKRIPIPAVLQYVRHLFANGATLYCWSSGGSEYARASATEFGIAHCFAGFLPKPDILIDDQPISEWRDMAYLHPQTLPPV
jgi:hypothetical protein